MLTITPTLARRLAITRQQLTEPRSQPTPEGIMSVLRAIRCLQIDPIRAVERTQYLVLWSRLGFYEVDHLHSLLWNSRDLFEYWAHAASIVLTEDYPLHQYAMHQYLQGNSKWEQQVKSWLTINSAFRDYILTELERRGPLLARELDDRTTTPRETSGWNKGRNVSQILSYLWSGGQIMVAGRQGIQKQWALTENWFPTQYKTEPLAEAEVVRQAAQLALRALGVGTPKQIMNHFIRGRYPGLNEILAELTQTKRIIPITIQADGSKYPGDWYIHSQDVPLLEKLQAGEWHPRTVLLSPFDNLICDRERTELLWDFHFRIEIYVPKAKRQYGYYVLPILHGDRFIGRIDPKMDRKTGVLHINAIYWEDGYHPDETTRQAVATTISELADFLGAQTILYPSTW